LHALNNTKMEQIKTALEQYAQKHPEIKDHILGIQFALYDAINDQYKQGVADGIEIAAKLGGKKK
jgi:hypothetical protein